MIGGERQYYLYVLSSILLAQTYRSLLDVSMQLRKTFIFMLYFCAGKQARIHTIKICTWHALHLNVQLMKSEIQSLELQCKAMPKNCSHFCFWYFCLCCILMKMQPHHSPSCGCCPNNVCFGLLHNHSVYMYITVLYK